MSFKSLFLSGVVALAATLTAAQAPAQSTAKTQDLMCVFKSKGQRGWLPPDMVVIDVPSKPSIVVLDSMIFQTNNKKPMAAKIDRVRGNKVTFSWALNLRATDGTSLRARYSGTLDRATRAMNIEVRVGNTGQRQFARGACQPRKS